MSICSVHNLLCQSDRPCAPLATMTCHAIARLLSFGPTWTDTCEMLTWSVADPPAPQDAALLVSVPHFSPHFIIPLFSLLLEGPQKSLLTHLSDPYQFFLLFYLPKWLRKLQPISQVSEQGWSTLFCSQSNQYIIINHFQILYLADASSHWYTGIPTSTSSGRMPIKDEHIKQKYCSYIFSFFSGELQHV